MSTRRYPLNRPPDGMVVEPPLPPMDPSQTSVYNSLANVDPGYVPPMTDDEDIEDFNPMEDFGEPEVRRAEPIPQGADMSRFDFSPFEAIADAVEAGDMELARQLKSQLSPVQRHVGQIAATSEEYTAEMAARDASEFMKQQARASVQQADPSRQAAQAEKVAQLQERYRQEMEYQRLLNVMNTPGMDRATWNAARIQLEGLAASIGQANNQGSQAAAALLENKRGVGFIGFWESKFPVVNFGPRIQMMQRGSQDRLAIVRQQMEAAGVPVPEIAAEEQAAADPVATKINDAVQRFGVRGEDGNPVTIVPSAGAAPQPVIKRMDQGRPVYVRLEPDGVGIVELTPQEVEQLGLQ